MTDELLLWFVGAAWLPPYKRLPQQLVPVVPLVVTAALRSRTDCYVEGK